MKRTATSLLREPRWWTCTALICALLLFASAHTAGAAGVVGTGTVDSCTDAALNAALADGGLVTFDCGGPATIDLGPGPQVTGARFITSDTIIDGGGLITLSGGNQESGFTVDADIRFTVENLTIANCRNDFVPTACGGAGGISNCGLLTVTNSTFIGNSSRGGAGGVYNFNNTGVFTSSTVAVYGSTFTGNTGNEAGGINNYYGTVTVANSTFTGNGTSNGGGAGGIVNYGIATVTNSTFTDNSDSGIQTVGPAASTLLRNTILANGASGVDNCSSINNHDLYDGGHNLDDGTSCGFSAANGSFSGRDPRLDPAGLQDNGGRHKRSLCARQWVNPPGASRPALRLTRATKPSVTWRQ